MNGDYSQPLHYDDFFVDIDGSEAMVSKPCLDCGKILASNGLLELHRQKLHSDPPLLTCIPCNLGFKRKMGLITHWRTAPSHRRQDNVKLMGCDICDAFNIVNGFRDEAAVQSHTRIVHGEDVFVNNSNQEKSFCPLCPSDFSYRKGMIEHLQILHGEHLLTQLLRASGMEMERLLDDLHFKCHVCSKTFRAKKSLTQHVEKVHGVQNSSFGVSPPKPSKFLVLANNSSPPVKKMRLDLFGGIETSPILKSLLPMPPEKIDESGGSVLSPSLVTCQICEKSFSRQSVLNVHTQMVHGKAPTYSLPRPKSETSFKITPRKVEGSVEDFLDGESLTEDLSSSD